MRGCRRGWDERVEVSVEIKKLASLLSRATKKEIEVRGRTIGVGMSMGGRVGSWSAFLISYS